jgi:uncharacterized protein (TIGR02569 family)
VVPTARTGPPPSREVRAAFDVGELRPLPGGQGATFTTGDVVLKPVLDEREAEWLAAVLEALPPSADLRVIRPVAAVDGRWVVDGWAAYEHLEGAERGGDWRAALDVSHRFHALVASVPWSPVLDRDHAWAVGDAFAWGERRLPVPARFRSVFEQLRSRREPIDETPQLVHGDLCGNILFHDDLPPAVIDVSPFWRPVRYADAIVVVDAIGWSGAEDAALVPFSDPVGRQLLIRAILFRLASALVLGGDDHQRLGSEVAASERIVHALER